jgi:meso-butanediol dehydrogenase / (S,S)-butanediol dehydrogenase / diacetyl reductase
MSAHEGRSILVVGGGSGIGFAAARLAAEAGARVLVADIDPACAASVEAIAGDTAFVRCDARDGASAQAAVDAAVARHGRLDGLLTTVGGAHLAAIEELAERDWREEIAFNLDSVFAVCRAAVPVLRAQRAGAIVTTSSGYALLPGTDRPGYVAAKAGVIAFTRSLAATLAPHRARANCLAPGPTDTPRFRAMNGGDAGVEAVRASMPMGEIPTPEDCAGVALFLLSDAARAVTGQVIHVNGGLVMA